MKHFKKKKRKNKKSKAYFSQQGRCWGPEKWKDLSEKYTRPRGVWINEQYAGSVESLTISQSRPTPPLEYRGSVFQVDAPTTLIDLRRFMSGADNPAVSIDHEGFYDLVITLTDQDNKRVWAVGRNCYTTQVSDVYRFSGTQQVCDLQIRPGNYDLVREGGWT